MDVSVFASLKQGERYDEALRHVRGPFMEDFPEQLSEWVDGERRHWNRQVARVCDVLAAREWHEGGAEKAIALARRWEQLGRGDPAASITLAGYLAANGESREALAVLNTFRSEHRSLREREAKSVDDAIAQLQAGALLILPKRRAFGADTSSPRGDDRPPKRPERANGREEQGRIVASIRPAIAEEESASLGPRGTAFGEPRCELVSSFRAPSSRC